MKELHKKLRSRVGASMILAMIFMLFCTFIGGSVLASATANAQRVAQMAEQQDFLLERSAALLVSDQFQMDSDDLLRLTVMDSMQTVYEMKKVNDGGVFEKTGRSVEQRVLSFQVTNSVELTDMHQLLLETTVYRYLREFAPGYAYNRIEFVNFPGDPTSLDNFLFQFTLPSAESDDYTIQGSMQVSATVSNSSGVTIPGYSANFTSGREENLFDFFVNFGADSQVQMTLNAYHGTLSSITVPSNTTEGNIPGLEGCTGYYQIISDITQHTISWQDPLIEKGGTQ